MISIKLENDVEVSLIPLSVDVKKAHTKTFHMTRLATENEVKTNTVYCLKICILNEHAKYQCMFHKFNSSLQDCNHRCIIMFADFKYSTTPKEYDYAKERCLEDIVLKSSDYITREGKGEFSKRFKNVK